MRPSVRLRPAGRCAVGGATLLADATLDVQRFPWQLALYPQDIGEQNLSLKQLADDRQTFGIMDISSELTARFPGSG